MDMNLLTSGRKAAWQCQFGEISIQIWEKITKNTYRSTNPTISRNCLSFKTIKMLWWCQTCKEVKHVTISIHLELCHLEHLLLYSRNEFSVAKWLIITNNTLMVGALCLKNQIRVVKSYWHTLEANSNKESHQNVFNACIRSTCKLHKGCDKDKSLKRCSGMLACVKMLTSMGRHSLTIIHETSH